MRRTSLYKCYLSDFNNHRFRRWGVKPVIRVFFKMIHEPHGYYCFINKEIHEVQDSRD